MPKYVLQRRRAGSIYYYKYYNVWSTFQMRIFSDLMQFDSYSRAEIVAKKEEERYCYNLEKLEDFEFAPVTIIDMENI